MKWFVLVVAEFSERRIMKDHVINHRLCISYYLTYILSVSQLGDVLTVALSAMIKISCCMKESPFRSHIGGNFDGNRGSALFRTAFIKRYIIGFNSRTVSNITRPTLVRQYECSLRKNVDCMAAAFDFDGAVGATHYIMWHIVAACIVDSTKACKIAFKANDFVGTNYWLRLMYTIRFADVTSGSALLAAFSTCHVPDNWFDRRHNEIRTTVCSASHACRRRSQFNRPFKRHLAADAVKS